jgi:M6 family metalloprotease-like protein
MSKNSYRRSLVVGLSIYLLLSFSSMAAPVYNLPVLRIQPNGDTLRCFVSGDEYFHRLHDEEGYTIVLNPETGEYVFASLQEGLLVPTAYVPGQVNPAQVGLRPNLIPSNEELKRLHQQWVVPEKYRPAAPKTSGRNHGVINNIVIFIRFADDASFTSGTFSPINNKFNDSTAGASSMYNYFKKASYNKLSVNTSFYPAPSGNVVLSYQDSHARSYFQPYSATNPYGYVSDSDSRMREFALLENAVNWVNTNCPVPSSLNLDVDNDGLVDNVCFVVNGTYTGWSDLLWPHKWSLYDRYVYINSKRVYTFNFQLAGSGEHYFGVSTLCHEMTHTLGCPDIYHYEDYTNVSPGGSWDLMNSNQTPPQQTNSLFKYLYLNWFDSIPELTVAGTYTMQSLASGPNHAYRVASSDRQQWYILEYRNSSDTFDSSIPGRGLLVWRYNESVGADNAGFDFFDTPHQLWLFRPNSAVDTINGNVSSAAFGVYGRTAFDSTTNPHPFLCDGTADMSFGLSNIQVGSDHNTVSFTFTPNPSVSCGGVATTPLQQGFETGGIGCWYSVSANSSNRGLQGVGTATDNFQVHDGQYSYRFSSYYSASDYNQYLISQRLPSTHPLHLTFYYRRSHTSSEQLRVTYSTTTDDIAAFADTLADINVVNSGWHYCDLLVPAGVKYLALNYYSNYKYNLYIDDISITDTLMPESDTILRDTVYVYQHDTISRWVHDTLYLSATDTVYYRVVDTMVNIVWDTVYVAPEMGVLEVVADAQALGTPMGGGTYPVGSTVEIAGIPQEGCRFSGWTDGNTDNPRIVTVTSRSRYEARFMRGVEMPGKEPENAIIVIHDTLIVRDTVWNDMRDTMWVTLCDTVWIPTAEHDTVWVDQYERVEVDTTTYFTLVTMSSDVDAGTTVGNGVYPRGTIVEVGALAKQGYRLLNWSDGTTDNPKHVVMDCDQTLVATFTDRVGVEQPAMADVKVYVVNATLTIEAPARESVAVYNCMGRMMYHRVGNRLEGDNMEAVKVMGLGVGVYVVKVGETGVKKVVVM